MDQFIKHNLKVEYYLRYSDDFILITDNKNFEKLVEQLEDYLENYLKLKLHPNKLIIRKLGSGIDFLGYVVLPHYIVLRTKTKKRMLKRVNKKNSSSYLGLLKHCKGYKLEYKILYIFMR